MIASSAQASSTCQWWRLSSSSSRVRATPAVVGVMLISVLGQCPSVAPPFLVSSLAGAFLGWGQSSSQGLQLSHCVRLDHSRVQYEACVSSLLSVRPPVVSRRLVLLGLVAVGWLIFWWPRDIRGLVLSAEL